MMRTSQTSEAHLLVVDDTPDNLRLLTEMLRYEGYKVRPVPNGRLALQAAEHDPPDLILLDILMPGMDGFETCRRLKANENTKDIPVIFTTALTDTENQVKGFDVGAVDYITKPINPAVVLARIRTHLELNRAKEALERHTEILEAQVKVRTAELAQINAELVSEIVERKRAEGRLLQLHKAVETMPLGVTISDLDGKIMYTNPADAEMHGYQVEELLGQDVRIFAPAELRGKPATLKQIRGWKGLVRESVNLRKDGTTFPVWLMSEVVRDAEGEPYAIVTSCEDITARKQAEEALRKARDELEIRVAERTKALRESLKKLEEVNLRLQEANRAKSQFLSSMSHELRTPLNAILGFTDLLRGQFFGKLNEKQVRYVNQIDDSGKHLLALINDLLDMAKIDAGAMELQLAEISPEEFIHATTAMMSGQFKKKTITLNTVIEPSLPEIAADLRKCKQIMLNLLSNAVKYTPEGGRVEVRATNEGDARLRVEVRDTGVGIDPGEIEKIFSEFHQIDRVRDEQLGGTGIGLALTRRLVALHGGEIGVESAVGQGSTFWFTLPVKKLPHKEVDQQEAPPREVNVPAGHRILIVEDNDVNLAMLLDMLNTQEHHVVVARNGQEAIELAQSHKPELILMDMRMPVMDGLEATRRLRAMAEFAEIPIIALTASTGTEAEEEQLAAGCTAHLAKPIQSKELFAVLQRYLR